LKRRAVIFSPEARSDLLRLYDWIAESAGARVAIGYIDRLESYCLGLDLASVRGHRRDDIRAGLRIIGFEKRVTIAFTVGDDDATILRLFYGGQDWGATL
jgi:toxin ParE1/3/4